LPALTITDHGIKQGDEWGNYASEALTTIPNTS